jgi:hypothetical protein
LPPSLPTSIPVSERQKPSQNCAKLSTLERGSSAKHGRSHGQRPPENISPNTAQFCRDQRSSPFSESRIRLNHAERT